MMSRNYRPLESYVTSVIDYNHIPWRIRQKMPKIQGYLIDASHLSFNDYRLTCFEEGCILIDKLHNKILWKSHYNVPSLLTRLKNLVNYWSYENSQNSTQIQKNKQFKLQQTYGN